MQFSTNVINAANASYAAAIQGAPTAAPPPSIAGAVGRIDGLNERLAQLSASLASISDVIGGPRPVGKGENSDVPAQSGLVYRINDSADYAHKQLSEIEELICSISRALG